MDYEYLNQLKCPQFVNFLSEEFQQDMLETSGSVISEDSLNLKNISNLSEIANEKPGENFEVVTKEASMQNKNNEGIIPKPFNFATGNRLKNVTTSAYKKVDFIVHCRTAEPSQYKLRSTVTKTKPFHLTESRKRKHESGSGYVPLAEQVLNFQKKSPERYHPSSKSFEPPQRWEPPSYNAKSPCLQAVKRRRIVHALSRAEQEQKEMEQMRENRFQANPLDPKIYGISTRPRLMRAAKKKEEHKKQMRAKRFKARGVPKNILSGPTGLGKKLVIPNTVPQSPTFGTEDRLERRREKEKSKVIPVKMNLPKQHSLGPPPLVPFIKTATKVEPFSFDRQVQERLNKKEQKIKEELEKETKGHKFHAQLLPDLKPSALPSVPVKLPTVPQPFSFERAGRSSKPSSLSVPENPPFRANPANVLRSKPFVPEKPERPLIDVQEFSLHTDRRASDRARLRQVKEAEEAEQEQRRLVQKAQAEAREQAELQELRRTLVHKAQPVRQSKPMHIQPSSVLPTCPVSPNFATDRRLRSARN